MRRALASIVAAACVAPGMSDTFADGVQSTGRERVVAVLALPDTASTPATPGSQRLAVEMANALQAAAFRVVVVGAPSPAPLEELVAASNSASADLTLGVRSLQQRSECVAVLVPEGRPAPTQPPGTLDQAALGSLVTGFMAAARAEESAKLAAVLAPFVKSCARTPTVAERYVLDGTNSPTVVLAIGVQEESRLVLRVPDLLKGWIALGRE